MIWFAFLSTISLALAESLYDHTLERGETFVLDGVVDDFFINHAFYLDDDEIKLTITNVCPFLF